MHLLTTEDGWASDHRRLFWTTDGGLNWNDVTPKTILPGSNIASVFFLDASTGWVLLASRDKNTDAVQFNLAFTTNAGTDWTVTRFDVPDPDPSRGLSDKGWIDFVDPLHGWVMVRMNSNTAVSFGVLLRTEDGGQTWKSPVQGPPVAGPLVFVNAKRGWLAGGPDDLLYVTDDAGEIWHQVSLATPAGIARESQSTFGLPIFENATRGFLPVSYSKPDGGNLLSALFVSSDGGTSWVPSTTPPTGVPLSGTTMAASAWISASMSGHTLNLRTMIVGDQNSAAGATDVRADLSGLGKGSNVEQLSFADTTHGWILLVNGDLFATSDGGMAWANVSPPRERATEPVLQTPSAREYPGEGLGARLGAPARLPRAQTATVVPTSQLGFDISRVMPSTDMQAWWNDSENPYWNTSVWLPGSPNRGNDVNLTPGWVAAIQGQGWGLIPIWFGLQSPCTCAAGSTKGGCVPFKKTFSSSPPAAEEQGVAEADAAMNSARRLGLSSGIIYHDIENYALPSACSLAVRAFLSGWTSELHAKSVSAGVYGNPAPAQADFSQASPQPDVVWIAKYDGRITIWGLKPLTDGLWANAQRMHQYLGNVKTSYGETQQYTIDPDILDAPEIAGSGQRSYTFTSSELDVPAGWIGTTPYGINNVNGDSGLISGSGQIGQIVGWYLDSKFVAHGSLDSGGSFSTVNAGASTVAIGINNLSQIVGYYTNTGSLACPCYGFVDDDGDVTTINYPGAFATEPSGINDDGEIVGNYSLSGSPDLHGFLYSSNSFTPIDCPGAVSTVPWGINGQGQISGSYVDQTGTTYGFLYNAGSCTSFSISGMGEAVSGINENGQISIGESLYSQGNFYPVAGVGYGLNDNVELVGINSLLPVVWLPD